MPRSASGGGKKKRPSYSPSFTAYPTPKAKPKPKPKPKPTYRAATSLGSGGGGFGYARDVKAASRQPTRTAQARGYGGARDVKAGQARRLSQRQQRGFGGARDRIVRREVRDALRRALAAEYGYETSTVAPDQRVGIRGPAPRGAGSQRAVRAAGLTGPQVQATAMAAAADVSPIERGVQRYVKAPALKGLEQLSRPIHGIAGGVRAGVRGEDVLTAVGRGAALKDRYLFSDVLDELGWDPNSGAGKALRGTVGFLLDVGLDPTTYVTGGATSVARQTALKSGARVGAAAGRATLRDLAPKVAAGDLSKREAERAAAAAARSAGDREIKRRMAKSTGKQRERGITVGIAGPRQVAGAARAVGNRRTLQREVRAIKQGRPQPVAKRPGKVRRAVRGRPVAAPLARGSAAFGRSQRAGWRAAGETALGRRLIPAGRAVRAAGAGAHAGIRPAGISIGEEAGIKAVRGEARSEAERLIRQSTQKSNALWRRLSKPQQRQVVDALEADDLSRLETRKVRDAAKQIRDELRYRNRIERRAGTLAGQVGRRSRTPREVALGAGARPAREGRAQIRAAERRLQDAEQDVKRWRDEYTSARRTNASDEVKAEIRRHYVQAGERALRASQRLRGVRRRGKEAEAHLGELRSARRERLAGQAQGYFPRIREEELAARGTLERIAEGPQPRARRSAKKPRPATSKQREERASLAAMRQGPQAQRIRAGQFSEDVRRVLAERSIRGARGVQAAKLNRGIVDAFGKSVPKNMSENTMKLLDERGVGVYRLRRGDLERLDLDDLPEIVRAGLRPEQRGPVSAQIPELRLKKQGEAGPGVEEGAGRYVVLRDEVVERALAEEAALGSGVAPLELFDAFNRTFKKLALMTPGYLARNLVGDTFNAWTEQAAWRLLSNAARGQRVLQAAGKAERAQRRRNVGKSRDAMRELAQLKVAGNRFGRMLSPGLREIRLTPEQAREIAGPSADRLYQAIRRGNPDLTPAQIRSQIERNLTSGKIPALHLAQLAEQAGVIRQGRFLELMQEARPVKGRGGGGWQLAVRRVEDSMRIATFIGGLRRGESVREAAALTNRVHFDYGDLTPFEKGVMRRAMPFYTFPSRNIPFQAQQLVRRPGKYATVQKAREEARKAAGLPEGYEGDLNEFDARQLPLPIKLGDQTYMLSMGAPFTDLNDVIELGGGVAALTGSPTRRTGTGAQALLSVPTRRIAEMLGPLKAGLELQTGRSFYFREDIEPEGRRYARAPRWAVAAAQIPGLGDEFRALTGMRQTEDGPVMWRKGAEHAVRTLSPGIVGLGVEASGLIPGANLGVEGREGRGRTRGQRLLSPLAGVRSTTYDPQQIRLDRLYERRTKVDGKLGDLRQLAKENAKAQGREATEEDWQTPRYERLLDRRRRLQSQIEAGTGEGEEQVIPPGLPGGSRRTRTSSGPRPTPSPQTKPTFGLPGTSR